MVILLQGYTSAEYLIHMELQLSLVLDSTLE